MQVESPPLYHQRALLREVSNREVGLCWEGLPADVGRLSPQVPTEGVFWVTFLTPILAPTQFKIIRS